MSRCNGFSLLEVVVSLFLLALALFGVQAGMVSVLREGRGVDYFQRALLLGEGMGEYLRGHGGDVSGYLREWGEDVRLGLPSGLGSVEGDYPNYRIRIRWGGEGVGCVRNEIGDVGCLVLEVGV